MPERDTPRPGSAAPASDRARLRTFFLRFALGFVLLEAFVYAVLWHERWFTPYGALNARVVAALLRPFLEVQAMGVHLVSPVFSIAVRPGCDGYQASAVLLAGVLAFPAAQKRKWLGATIGVAVLLALNLLRLAALLWAGVHHPEHFELLHITVLPGLFVGVSLFLLLAWAHWARD